MAKDATEKVTAPVEEPKPEPALDPYAGLEGDVRAAAEEAHKLWGGWSPAERAAAIELARKGYEVQLKSRQQPPAEPKPESPPRKASEPDDEDVLTKIERRLETFEKKLQQKEEQDKRAQEATRFERAIEKVLESSELDDDAKALGQEGFEAHYIKYRDQITDVEGAFKRYLKRYDERDAKKQKAYIEGKVKTREMAGEAGGGTVPARQVPEVTKDDLDRGTIADQVKKLFSGAA